MFFESFNYLFVVLEKEMSLNNYLYIIGFIWIMLMLCILLFGLGVLVNVK